MKKIIVSIMLLLSVQSFAFSVPAHKYSTLTLNLDHIGHRSVILASSKEDIYHILSSKITNFKDELCFLNHMNSPDTLGRLAIGEELKSIRSYIIEKDGERYLAMIPNWSDSISVVTVGIRCKLKE